MCFKQAAATVLLMCGPFCSCAARSAHMRSVLLICGPFCSCAARSAHVRPVLPAESFDSDPFFRWKVLFRYVLFVAACYIYGQSVRSSLQSVPTGLPAKSSHYGKNGPAENLRRHLSSQKQVSDKEREPVFPDEFSDGEIMTTTRNYFRKKVLAQGYIGENGNFLLAESPRAWST